MVPNPNRLAIRWIALFTILAAELIAITAHYELPLLPVGTSWAAELFYFSKELWRLGLWVTGVCVLILSPGLGVILGELRKQSTAHPWFVWIILHLVALIAFWAFTAYIFARLTDPTGVSTFSFNAWFGLGGATLLLWLLALAPSRFWLGLLQQRFTQLLLGSLLGIGAWMTHGMLIQQEAPLAQGELWNVLAEPTLRLVYWLLGWLYSDLVYKPDNLLVGTTSFSVEISFACSGIEGISLIGIFLAIYLWLFRNELRFPQAFWLFPIGMIAIWLANAVRIAALIVVGTRFSPEVAIRGFHAQAGWITFTLIAVGAIALLHKTRCFTSTHPGSPEADNSSTLATALIVPMLVLMAATMLTSAVSTGINALYPLCVLATATILWYFRKHYRGLDWRWSWPAMVIGVSVFLFWMLLEPASDDSSAVLAQRLNELPAWGAIVWVVFRVLGSTITVPLAEELAFRGYLMRKLVAEDFENVSLKRFTWRSFIISSVVFGLLHDRWLAGTLAGMGYALAVYRHGRLGDGVMAHATSNALIAVWVLTQGQWSLWS